jgi:betaine-aldehyde dehydrogenase
VSCEVHWTYSYNMSSIPNQLFINGQFRAAAGGKSTPVINPATEAVITEVASADMRDVEDAVQGAQAAFAGGWRDLAPGKRAEVLFKVAQRIRDNLESLAQLECQNIGKPISDARDEIGLGARVFEFYAGAVSRFYGQTIPVARGGFDYTLRVPMGVVAAIVPWNFPFPIACWKVAPALAAGNTVVLKPASLSPLTAIALGQLAFEAGLPPGVLQVITGSGQVIGDALVAHPVIRKVSFTGSTAVGSRIMSLAARDIKRVSLELGGKSPNIVFADADWERAADTSPMSVFANTGQDCCARSRMFAERPIFDRFVERFVASTNRLVVGDPAKPETQIGPMVSAGQRENVESYVQDARNARRKVATGGNRPSGKGYFYPPTVLLDVDLHDRCWREEIFGPVVCIRPFTDEATMLEEVNASPYGLSGSLWTSNLSRAFGCPAGRERCAQRKQPQQRSCGSSVWRIQTKRIGTRPGNERHGRLHRAQEHLRRRIIHAYDSARAEIQDSWGRD